MIIIYLVFNEMIIMFFLILAECGHVSCFWCVHESMDAVHESHCPICRHPYHYFPTICEMLHFLLIKLYPLAYKKREAQIYSKLYFLNFLFVILDMHHYKSIENMMCEFLLMDKIENIHVFLVKWYY